MLPTVHCLWHRCYLYFLISIHDVWSCCRFYGLHNSHKPGRSDAASVAILTRYPAGTLVRFTTVNTGRQSNRSGKYPRCSDLSLRGKNMHSMKARFVLLICKLSPGHSGLSRCSISCRKLVWWAHGIYPYWWLGWKGYVRRFPWRI